MSRLRCATCGAESRGGAYCAMCGTRLSGDGVAEPVGSTANGALGFLAGRFASVRRRGEVGVEVLRSWSGSNLALARLRRELRHLNAERDGLLYALGDAVHRSDERARANASAALASVDEQLAAVAAETSKVVESFRSHVQEERQALAPTEIASRTDGDAASS